MKTTKRKFIKVLYLLIPMSLGIVFSCSDSFLNQPAKGALLDSQLQSQAGIEAALIGTYSALKGSVTVPNSPGTWATDNTNWVYGGLVGADAFKGSNSGDQSDINPLTQFVAPPTNSYLKVQWQSVYDGVNRANVVIKTLNSVVKATPTAISADDQARILGEAKFLRAFFHMEAKMMWNNVPYVDETIDYSKGNYKIANTEDIWPKIEQDFLDAYNTLKESGMAKGRANKWAAGAFLGKVYLFEKKWTDALSVLNDVITKGVTPGGSKYSLNARFHDSFDAITDNSPESVFALQSSVNDGSGAANANANNVLNYPYLSSLPVGCCGFNQPSFDLANSYRTTSGGLPYLDGTYNDHPLTDLQWMAANTPASVPTDNDPLDPRIDWTLARTGVPYYDWGVYTGAPWVRSLSDGGPYTPKKAIFSKTEIGSYTDGSSWTPGYNAVNFTFMRFAEVLLMRAEAAVETNDLATALSDVNTVRTRAAKPEGFVRFSKDPTKDDYSAYLDNTIKNVPAGNYVIANYASFPSQSYARNAVHFERKLELGMEGKRFFDLVRWGETSSANANGNPVNLQQAIDYNGKYNSLSKGVSFTVGKNEYYPIPQDQIDLNQVNGVSVLKQNPGY
jgi:hypothetical protein